MHTASVTLLHNEAATSAAMHWPGGKGNFVVVAAFGGGSVALQYLASDNATWITHTDSSLTAAGMFNFELPPGQIRALVTTATAVYAIAARIPI